MTKKFRSSGQCILELEAKLLSAPRQRGRPAGFRRELRLMRGGQNRWGQPRLAWASLPSGEAGERTFRVLGRLCQLAMQNSSYGQLACDLGQTFPSSEQ